MAKLIYELEGVRGRSLKLYDTKCVITTKKTVGSLITGNFTDGEKTIFLCDVVGIQFKKSGGLIGYLQFETPSLQMNNKSDNMFSENTFTFESGKNGITNELIETVYEYVTNRIEEIKYGTLIINNAPVAEVQPQLNEQPISKAPQSQHTADSAVESTLQTEISSGEEETEREEAEQERKKRLEQMSAFRSRGLCQHCGGEFKGLTTKKCSKCGIPKNY